MRLPEHQSLIMRTGHAPVKAGQFVWYKERGMKNLAMTATIIPVQKLMLAQFLNYEDSHM